MLNGVSVLDISRMLPGPLCSWYLQGMGARVDRVESPKGGDMTRSVPPFDDGVGVFYAALNRGNRSCALDLRHPQGVEALCALIPHYDVLIEGFRPGVMEAAGVPMDRVRELNERIVVARISGYGQTGPWAQRSGHDVNYVGMAGIPIWGARCAVPPVQIADSAGGLVAALGIVGALFARERTGLGDVLDISLTEAALGVVAPHLAMMSAEDREPIPGGEFLSGGLPTYGTYRCEDGKWLTLGALEPKFQTSLHSKVGNLGQAHLESVLATKPRDEWVELLEEACVGPCLSPTEIGDHELHQERRSVERLGRTTFVKPPFSSDHWHEGAVPKLGEHTRVMLTEAGISISKIEKWYAAGALSGK